MKLTQSRLEKNLSMTPDMIWTALNGISVAQSREHVFGTLREFLENLGLFDEIVFFSWDPRTASMRGGWNSAASEEETVFPVDWHESLHYQLSRRAATMDPFLPFAPLGIDSNPDFTSKYFYVLPILIDKPEVDDPGSGASGRLDADGRMLEALFLLGCGQPLLKLDRSRMAVESIARAAERVISDLLSRESLKKSAAIGDSTTDIYNKGLALILNNDFSGLIHGLCADILGVLGFDRCVVFKLSNDGSALYPVNISGSWNSGSESLESVSARDGVIAMAMETGKRISMPGSPENWSVKDAFLEKHTLNGAWICPIRISNKTQGLIIAFCDSHSKEILPLIAEQGLSTAAELTALGLKCQALEDDLTNARLQLEISWRLSGVKGHAEIETFCFELDRFLCSLMHYEGAAICRLDSNNEWREVWTRELDSAKLVDILNWIDADGLIDSEADDASSPLKLSKKNWLSGSYEGRRFLFIPLFFDDALSGAILVLNPESVHENIKDRSEPILNSFARSLGQLWDSREQSEINVIDLTKIQAALSDTAAMSRKANLFEIVAEMVSELIPYDELFLHFWDRERNRLELRTFKSTDELVKPSEFLTRRQSPINFSVLDTGESFISADVAQDPRFQQTNPRHQVRALMCVPIKAGTETIGTVTAQSYKPGMYSREDMKVFDILGLLAANLYRVSKEFIDMLDLREDILSSFSAGVITVDEKGLVLMLNPEAQRILGLKSGDLIGEHFCRSGNSDSETAFDSLPGELTRGIREALETGGQLSASDVVFGAGGESRVVDLKISPFPSTRTGGMGVMALLDDVTLKRKRQQRMLDDEKMRFSQEISARVAHEIRNPLNAIGASAQFLEKKFAGEPRIARLAGIIVEETQRLNNIVVRFLESAKNQARENGIEN